MCWALNFKTFDMYDVGRNCFYTGHSMVIFACLWKHLYDATTDVNNYMSGFSFSNMLKDATKFASDFFRWIGSAFWIACSVDFKYGIVGAIFNILSALF